MKKSSYFIITMLMLLLFSFEVYAEEKGDITLDDGTKITEFEEEILENINNSGPRAELGRDAVSSDIHFEKSYRVYSSESFFKKGTDEKSVLEDLLSEETYVWQVPVFVDGQTVLVDIDKVRHINEDIPEESKRNLRKLLGKWSLGAMYVCDDTVDFRKNAEDSLSRAGFNPDDYTYEFVSGIPGIRYPVAVVFDENTARYVIPAEEAAAYAFEGEWDTAVNKASASDALRAASPSDASRNHLRSSGDGFDVYRFEDVADASNRSNALGLSGGIGISPKRSHAEWKIVLGAGVCIFAAILCCVKRREKR